MKMPSLFNFAFSGLVIFYLTSEVTANSTSTMVSLSISPSKASTSTIASSTVDFSTMPPKTQSPASGYGHFNISGADGKPCLLLDISCAVTLQLQSEASVFQLWWSYDEHSKWCNNHVLLVIYCQRKGYWRKKKLWL